VALFKFGESCPSFLPHHLSPLILYPIFPHSVSAQAPHPTLVAGVGVGTGSPWPPNPIPVAAPALPGGLGDQSSLVAQAFPLTAAAQAFPSGRASLPGDRARSWPMVAQVGGAPPEVPLTQAKEQRSGGSAANRTNHQDLGMNRRV
jgi:hypothetical protein